MLSQNGEEQRLQLQKLAADSEHIKAQISAVPALFCETPKQLGYPFSGASVKDHVRVNDSLDQELLLPIQLCSSVEVCRLSSKLWGADESDNNGGTRDRFSESPRTWPCSTGAFHTSGQVSSGYR